MQVRNVIAGATSAVVLFSQTALAGSLAPVVDCNVTPNAEECQVVTLAPAGAGSSGVGGLGTLGTVAAIGGVVAAAGIIAAVADDDDDDDDENATTTTTSN